MKINKNKSIILKTIFILIFISLFLIPDPIIAAGKYFYTKEELSGKKIEEGDTNSGFTTKEACTAHTLGMNASWNPSSCYIGDNATITSISSISGKVGDIITIKGTALNYIDSVSFNGKDAGYSNIYIQTQIKVTVPSGATSGPIKINTKYRGTATSTSFTIKNNSDTYWWYLNKANEFYGASGRLTTPGFTDESTCNTARLAYEGSSSQAKTTGPCFQDTETQILKDKADSYNLNAQKDKPTMDTVYTLLAPIGDLITAPTNIGDYFNILLEIAIGLCAVLAVIMIVIGGIQYMGDESIFGKTEAKGQITKAILGLLIALGAFALLNTIDPALLGKNGVKINSVSIDIEEPPILSDAGKTVPQKNSFPDCKGGVRSVQTTGIGTVQHFIFCAAYATKLQQLFTVAYQANPKIVLTGGAFRTYEEQLQARKDNNCPNVLTSPANKCTPPTAIPGTSLHEQGLAIDLYCDGKLINIVDNPSTKKCFDWLKTNAGVYGFKNFEKENWHWSIGPNAGH